MSGRLDPIARWQSSPSVDPFVQAMAELYPAAQRSEGDWLEECEAMHAASIAPPKVSLRGNGIDLLLVWLEER